MRGVERWQRPSRMYRLVVFEEIDDPQAVRDLFCRVTGLHPTDAMQWIARAPGTWPRPLPRTRSAPCSTACTTSGVAAEAWRVDQFPDLSPPRDVHAAACLAEGFRVKGLRGEPTHWVPWEKIELIAPGGSRPRTSSATSSPPPGPRRWPRR